MDKNEKHYKTILNFGEVASKSHARPLEPPQGLARREFYFGRRRNVEIWRYGNERFIDQWEFEEHWKFRPWRRA